MKNDKSTSRIESCIEYFTSCEFCERVETGLDEYNNLLVDMTFSDMVFVGEQLTEFQMMLSIPDKINIAKREDLNMNVKLVFLDRHGEV